VLTAVSRQIRPVDNNGRSGVADEDALRHGAIHVKFLVAEMEITEQSVTAFDAVAQRGGSIEPAADSDEAEMPDAACLHHERQRDPTLGMNGAAFGLQQVLYDSLCMHGRTPSQFGRYE
jgi:hypothetical protein